MPVSFFVRRLLLILLHLDAKNRPSSATVKLAKFFYIWNVSIGPRNILQNLSNYASNFVLRLLEITKNTPSEIFSLMLMIQLFAWTSFQFMFLSTWIRNEFENPLSLGANCHWIIHDKCWEPSEEIHKEIEFFVFVNLLRLMLLLIGTLTFCYEVTSSSVVANRVTGQQKGTAGHSL